MLELIIREKQFVRIGNGHEAGYRNMMERLCRLGLGHEERYVCWRTESIRQMLTFQLDSESCSAGPFGGYRDDSVSIDGVHLSTRS